MKRSAPSSQHHKTVLPVRRNAPAKKQRVKADNDPSLLPPAAIPSLITVPQPNYLRFTGSRSFRDRLVLATLSARPIRIDGIRALEERPGLREYEVSLLRLLETISAGSRVSINETGSAIKYVPGSLHGGDVLGLSHQCCSSRGLSYWLLPLLQLAPFCRNALRITLTGCSYHADDISVDVFRAVTIPLAARFGLDPRPSLSVRRRAFPPLADGEAVFSCPVVKQLSTVNLTAPGLIKRVRGLAATVRCSPLLSSAAIAAARGPLNLLLPDVHITADHCKGKAAGGSAGYALSLWAETTTGMVKAREAVGQATAEGGGGEALGSQVVSELLTEVQRGGCVDGLHAGFVFILMSCGPEAVSRVRIGKLSSAAVETLRLCELFLGVRMQLQPEPETDTVLVTAMGSGLVNISRKAA